LAKTIAVSDDVYDLLRKAKVPGESYSDVIRRGLKRGLRLSDIAGSGTITVEQWNRTQKVLRTADQVNRKKLRTLLQ
jgi:predicted CopG family antitoxin